MFFYDGANGLAKNDGGPIQVEEKTWYFYMSTFF
jgi:hypothetical protein